MTKKYPTKAHFMLLLIFYGWGDVEQIIPRWRKNIELAFNSWTLGYWLPSGLQPKFFSFFISTWPQWTSHCRRCVTMNGGLQVFNKNVVCHFSSESQEGWRHTAALHRLGRQLIEFETDRQVHYTELSDLRTLLSLFWDPRNTLRPKSQGPTRGTQTSWW